MADQGIDLLVTLGVIALVVTGVVYILQYMGIVIPRIVFMIGGIIIGILALLWVAKMLRVLV